MQLNLINGKRRNKKEPCTKKKAKAKSGYRKHVSLEKRFENSKGPGPKLQRQVTTK